MSNEPKSAKELIAPDRSKNFLQLVICGSAGDGKSLVIDRLSDKAEPVVGDQLARLKRDSEIRKVRGEEFDFSLLPGGLNAGHEQGSPNQGSPNDVAYSHFSTGARNFIVAETPGDDQYTGKLLAAASTADLAVLLVDARKGVHTQTRRHAYLLSLLGVKHIVLAINKIDLVDYSSSVFAKIDRDFKDIARSLEFISIKTIPVSALNGDGVTETGPQMPWYEGPALLSYLEKIEIITEEFTSFRFSVHEHNLSNHEFCELSGTILGGTITVGDEVMVTSSLQKSRLRDISTFDGKRQTAGTGDAVTLVLADKIDAGSGDLLASPGDLPERTDQFQAKIVWMHEEALLAGRSYQLKIGQQITNVQITDIKYAVNVDTLEHLAAPKLEMNEIGICNLATSKPVFFDAFNDNPATGSFILVDRLTKVGVGAGIIEFGLRRADNLSWQSFETDAVMRAEMKGQNPSILWFTGLSASGKSTIVDLVDRKLIAKGVHTYVLDGDNVRHGLNKDLGFTDVDRVENIRRIAEVARLMADAGLVVLVSFISPFTRERKLAREIAGATEFYEIFVDTPLEICEARDPKGLYAKARSGDLANFTGISSPFEVPENPDLSLPGASKEAQDLADMVIEKFNL